MEWKKRTRTRTERREGRKAPARVLYLKRARLPASLTAPMDDLSPHWSCGWQMHTYQGTKDVKSIKYANNKSFRTLISFKNEECVSGALYIIMPTLYSFLCMYFCHFYVVKLWLLKLNCSFRERECFLNRNNGLFILVLSMFTCHFEKIVFSCILEHFFFRQMHPFPPGDAIDTVC